MGLHQQSQAGRKPTVNATGGGAYRFADAFKQRLGIALEKEDEVQCLVSGTDFLLSNIEEEAFTFLHGQRHFISMRNEDIYPYLLVNVGSGVSILKVDRNGCRRVSGTNIGGGTFWGLCRLLTGVESFDEMLQLSTQGDNENVDMLVGDIYGGLDYNKLGLSSSTIASSFGKVVTGGKPDMQNVDRADMALSLLRMISYNIGHLGVMNALQHDVRHIFFGGYFIRNHPFTMETISVAVAFWSESSLSAKFMRHEGYLGALGAFFACEDHASPERPHLLVHEHESRGECDGHAAGASVDSEDAVGREAQSAER
jgi:type II pantothenate kinase